MLQVSNYTACPHRAMCECVQIPNAHPLGVTAVSWAPAAAAGSLIAAKGPGQAESRFASSGADNTVKVLAWAHQLLIHPAIHRTASYTTDPSGVLLRVLWCAQRYQDACLGSTCPMSKMSLQHGDILLS